MLLQVKYLVQKKRIGLVIGNSAMIKVMRLRFILSVQPCLYALARMRKKKLLRNKTPEALNFHCSTVSIVISEKHNHMTCEQYMNCHWTCVLFIRSLNYLNMQREEPNMQSHNNLFIMSHVFGILTVMVTLCLWILIDLIIQGHLDINMKHWNI